MSPGDDPQLLIKAGSFLPKALITQGMRLEEKSWHQGAAKLAQDKEEDTINLAKPRPNAIPHGPSQLLHRVVCGCCTRPQGRKEVKRSY
jgi:hypothetical protein